MEVEAAGKHSLQMGAAALKVEQKKVEEAEEAIAGWGTQFAELQEQYVQFKQQSAERQLKLEEELMVAELALHGAEGGALDM